MSVETLFKSGLCDSERREGKDLNADEWGERRKRLFSRKEVLKVVVSLSRS